MGYKYVINGIIIFTSLVIYLSSCENKKISAREQLTHQGILNITKNDSLIKRAILNRASLEDLKFILSDIAEKNTSFDNEDYNAYLYVVKKNGANLLKYSVPLGNTLKVIKSYFVLNEFEKKDTTLAILNSLIIEFEQSHPFDVLKPEQKYFFNNIRDKLGDSYQLVESDVNEIVQDFDEQNKLVDEYLTNAKNAYLNSKRAMFIAFLSLLTTVVINLLPSFKDFYRWIKIKVNSSN